MLNMRLYSVVVITVDFDFTDSGSNPDRTYLIAPKTNNDSQISQFLLLATFQFLPCYIYGSEPYYALFWVGPVR